MHDESGSRAFYSVNYHTRQILTHCEGIACAVSFNAAFSHAMNCLHRIEDAQTHSAGDMLYLMAYHHYLTHAPIYAEFSGPAPRA